ncbi:MAG: MBL fold metallo-hydrolase [Lewinellaceae bacterium]|nr:MBL fold metallo-hydrolase [Lewinellaceae bacterium]
MQENHYLIDCGEGTQIRMDEFRVRRYKIKQIFISHLHGDHIYGLIGFVFSVAFRQNGADGYLRPSGFEEIIRVQLKYAGGLSFPCDSILRIRSSIGLFSKMPQLKCIPCRSFIGRRLPVFYSRKKNGTAQYESGKD